MKELFRGLAFGLGIAVVVIFLLLTAYFQSVLLALTAVAADELVRIPMADGVDSLNVATAAAVTFHALGTGE